MPRRKKTHEEFVAEVRELVGAEYIVLETYKGALSKLEIKHVACGESSKVLPSNFLTGRRCFKCFGRSRKTTRQFEQDVARLTKDEYRVLGEYKTNDTKTKMLHVYCGNIYEVVPRSFIYGNSRCPKCTSSKGEDSIRSWLSEKEIKYETQYRVDECRFKNPLPFDFRVFNGESTTCLIEYDGEQHFKPVENFGGELGFKRTQRNDAIKTKYCADNNIPLIRIPYWEYVNIDAILTEKLLPLVYNSDKRNAS